jgi:uncharacterized membrane protein
MQPFGGAWGWMYWNLALAMVPPVLAFVLFRSRARLTVLWWIGVAAFVAFLPNAPYVLTDVVHLRWDIARDATGTTEIAVRYCILIGAGMAAYVVAMWRCSRFLFARSVRMRVIAAVDVAACALCSIGIYLGRVHRFNSWDVVRAPHVVLAAVFDGLSSHIALAGMGVVFAATAFCAFVGILALESVTAILRRPAR